MYVIGILNSKGGCGKTTLCANLARAFQQDGYNTLIVDTDQQGSIRDWHGLHGDDISFPPVVAMDRPTIRQDLPRVGKGADLVVIDGAAKSRDVMLSAMLASDLVVIPVQPSGLDIWGAHEIAVLIKERQEVTDGRPRCVFVVSRQILRTVIAREATEELAQYGFPVLTARTSQRVAYAESMSMGMTVLDYEPEGAAAYEIRAIKNELITLIDGEEERTA